MLSIKFFCRRLFNLFVCDSDREIVLPIRLNLCGDAREVAERAVALGCQTIHCESSSYQLDPVTPPVQFRQRYSVRDLLPTSMLGEVLEDQ